MPVRKSLFGKENRSGLPIGNLTSQFWGNVYLHELDQVVKHRLGVRWYVRYVDDLVRPRVESSWWRGSRLFGTCCIRLVT